MEKKTVSWGQRHTSRANSVMDVLLLEMMEHFPPCCQAGMLFEIKTICCVQGKLTETQESFNKQAYQFVGMILV